MLNEIDDGSHVNCCGGRSCQTQFRSESNTTKARPWIAKEGKICHEPQVISVSSLDVYNIGALPHFESSFQFYRPDQIGFRQNKRRYVDAEN